MTKPKNTPRITTKRLILRKFTEVDLEDLFQILRDPNVNRFLPWYPLETLEEVKSFYQERYQKQYQQDWGYAYAICLKTDDSPIGYINVAMEEPYDFGYGLRQEFWHQGIVTEAAMALVEQLKADGLPYITATHDVLNPRSGSVMKQIGMTHCYSYEEQWQPKNLPVIFRLYQMNFYGNNGWIYDKYWQNSQNHFIEKV